MKIYVRKIKDHDITHQISIRKNIVEEFFENNETIKVKGKKSKEERIVKILPATDPRFNAEIEHLIATEGGVEVGDIFVMYKENSFYTLEVIKQNDPKFAAIQEMCEADERHTLLYVDTGEAIVDLEKEDNQNHYIISIKDYSTMHKRYFDKYGYMYWEEGLAKKYNINDVFYLYFSSDNGIDISKIKKKAIVTDIGIPKSQLDLENYFENVDIENNSNANSFIKVKIVGETDSDDLSYRNLNLQFGFIAPQLGSKLIDNKQLLNYIEEHFIVWDKAENVLTEETLGQILKAYYESNEWTNNTGIMVFGIKYGDYIESHNMNKKTILEKSGIGESYIAELSKALALRNFVNITAKNKVNADLSNIERKNGGFNKIYYGIPGCGKSFVANQECLEKTNENKELIVRTTFYPDYTNSDFIG